MNGFLRALFFILLITASIFASNTNIDEQEDWKIFRFPELLADMEALTKLISQRILDDLAMGYSVPRAKVETLVTFWQDLQQGNERALKVSRDLHGQLILLAQCDIKAADGLPLLLSVPPTEWDGQRRDFDGTVIADANGSYR